MRKPGLIPTLILLTVLSSVAIAQDGWPVSKPEDVGLDVRALAAFDAELKAGKYGYVDSMLVIRRGKLVFDRTYQNDYDRIYGTQASKPSPLNSTDPTGPYNYFNPWWHPYYRRGDLHSLQSVTKTITSVIIGVAVTRKEFPDLDTPVLKYFDEKQVTNLDDRKRRMTIRHLLTMTDGLDWNENLPYSDPGNAAISMEASFDWVKFTINYPMAREPGTVFNYNSGATQLLSYIFRSATGKDIEEYAVEHLFRPLGIERHFWKRSPSGLIDTEGGLYLHPHDLARIWQLYLNDGVWNGRRIVSSAWVKASLTPAVSVGNTLIKYGYKWWLRPYGGDDGRFAWAGSGFGGQMPIAIPELDLIMVFTGWNILGGNNRLGPDIAIQKVLGAVIKK